MKRLRVNVMLVMAIISFTAGVGGETRAQENAGQYATQFVRVEPGLAPDSLAGLAAHVVPSQRQMEWQQREVTVFIHFGINTFTGKEWGDRSYLPAMFDPTALDARQWAAAAKSAGAELLLMVAKHHDGFCLWPSAYTDFSVKNSPWKNGQGDVIAEVAGACREYGLKFGFYLSPWDIHSPLYGTDAYNEYFRNQLRELLTGYGEVAEVWFDGACGEGPNGRRQVYDWSGYYKVVRELQPEAVIAVTGPDVRWVGTESGYGRETEWSVVPLDSTALKELEISASEGMQMASFHPAMDMQQADLGSREKLVAAAGLAWYPSEVDVSIRPGWFYHPEEDSLVKSPEKLAGIYFSSVGRNSVLLLNLPPDKRGLIHENDVQSLQGFREIIDQAFEKNLLKEARAEGCTGQEWAGLTDGALSTSWSPSPDGTWELLIAFDRPRTFDCLMLQENIRHGQRVESFTLEAFMEGSYKNLCTGSTIGFKRLIPFTTVTSDRIRFRIQSSRDIPEIATLGLFLTNVHIKN